MTAPRIFVSHNYHDVSFCQAFVNGLRENGADVWYDVNNMGAGVISAVVAQEITSRPHFIVILSAAALQSQWVMWEIAVALEAERQGKLQTFLPVIAEPCRMPPNLARYRLVGQPGGESLGIDGAVRETIKAVLLATSAQSDARTSSPLPPGSHNSGIVQTGGSISADKLAVGDHATIIDHSESA